MLNEEEQQVSPEKVDSGRGLQTQGVLLIISASTAIISWGHFFLNMVVDTGIASNVFIGMLSVGLFSSVYLFEKLRARLRRRTFLLGFLVAGNFGATVLLQALAIRAFG
ncbi:hypothetical protein ICM05_05960 [Leucobacter sp. cx-42]|uniref:hypothetical protein n=1 Tax=unclassified Leucobacter TaxID=2621730 RepID=UPI00165D63D9|nr:MULTISPECIES: hypothetical protein [unclassified Leucobacter]MBC9954191.1 hypothetical protein [Leucobacter sp. cx-42]